jgi:iron(III) transport system ATP-binding protein
LRVELRAMVRELQLESGITTVFVTHDQEEALALSDVSRSWIAGGIVQVGRRGRSTRTGQRYAADFLGSANVIRVKVEGEGREARGHPMGEGDLNGIVEHVEFRGSVTGYRVRTELGILHVDVWGSERIWSRGDEVAVRFHLPPSSGEA